MDIRFLESPRFFALDRGIYHYIQLAASELSCADSRSRLADRIAMLLGELLAVRGVVSPKPARLVSRMAPAIAYLEEHSSEAISAHKLAKLCHFSVSRFHAAFLTHTERTPGQYLTELRMQRALTMLQETSLPVGDIALAVGYSSQPAFTHAFRRYFGVSPGRYRAHRESSVTKKAVILKYQ